MTPDNPGSLKPTGRSLADFPQLLPAEKKLLAACREGKIARIGEAIPEARSDDNHVRASFLRFLALGGDEQAPVHEHGVQLAGAWVEGEFDLRAVRVPANLYLLRCHFDLRLVLLDTRIAGALNLGGCRVPGILSDRLVCDGSVFLDRGFEASGEVRLLGAQIGGNLSCENATFDGKDGAALSVDRAVIKGGVLLNQGFKASGEVRLLGAQIGGNLACGGALFDGKDGAALSADGAVIKGYVFFNQGFKASGEVRLLGTQIGGDLACTDASFDGKDGAALSADGMEVGGAFFFRGLAHPVSGVSLASTHVGLLVDDAISWSSNLVLDGFTYGHIGGGAPTDAPTRLAWLAKQRPSHYGVTDHGKDFTPQPWQQLIRTLRAMGHEEDAREVAIEREQHLRRIGRVGQTPSAWSKPRALPYHLTALALHGLFGLLIAYGYRPLRLLFWMFLVWLICGTGYWAMAQQGVFAPGNPLVSNHPAYAHCRPGYQPDHAKAKPKVGNWFVCPELAGEYTGFSPLTYSLDLILPLVDLQQERDWAPIIPTPKAIWYEELLHFSFNHFARWLVWFEILFGWIASLLLVAVLTGLTNRDKE